MVGNLNHIFLVDHDAIGFGHEVPKYGVSFFSFFGLYMSFNERAHHSAPGYARADDAAGSDQR